MPRAVVFNSSTAVQSLFFECFSVTFEKKQFTKPLFYLVEDKKKTHTHRD